MPSTALALMRSRYAAYALRIPEYIVQTTHPASPQFSLDTEQWLQDIEAFCKETTFERLEILSSHEQDNLANVVFVAHLTKNEENASFTEKSFFEKRQGKWLYRSGQLTEGHAPHLVTTNQPRLLPLAYYGDPILTKEAERIHAIDDDLRKLVEEMIETMDACDGIGLAAPQVHHSIKLFVMHNPVEKGNKTLFQGVKVMLNPEISSPSADTSTISEGCLSIPTIHADVQRPSEITIEYTDMQGTRLKERVKGWAARIIQHENDHLNGILFIDRLSESEKQKLQPFLEHLKNRIHDGTEL